MRWQTTVQPEIDSFRKWADDLAQAFVRLEPTILNSSSPFTGQIVQTTVGDIQISRVSASGHKVNRLAASVIMGAKPLLMSLDTSFPVSRKPAAGQQTQSAI